MRSSWPTTRDYIARTPWGRKWFDRTIDDPLTRKWQVHYLFTLGSGLAPRHRSNEMNNEVPLTMSVPEAGERYFDLSRNGSYNAAAKGIIPTIRVGRLLRVPVR